MSTATSPEIRTEQAEYLLNYYDEDYPLQPIVVLSDMIADLMHYCDAYDINWEQVVQIAATQYVDEKNET